MNRLFDKPCDADALSPLNLAFVGDTVFDLLVRERLLCQANRPVNAQHALAARQVKAAAQAAAAKTILPVLTEREEAVFRRGRNAHSRHRAKNASEGDYHYATGLEALFGDLYLRGELERLRALFELIIASGEETT